MPRKFDLEGAPTSAKYLTTQASGELSNEFDLSTLGDCILAQTVTAGVATLEAIDWGTSDYVLTSNGAGSAPTFKALPASGIANVVEDTTPQLGGNLDGQATYSILDVTGLAIGKSSLTNLTLLDIYANVDATRLMTFQNFSDASNSTVQFSLVAGDDTSIVIMGSTITNEDSNPGGYIGILTGQRLYFGDANNNYTFYTDTTKTSFITDIQIQKHAYYDGEYDNGDSGAAKTIDWGNGNVQKVTLTDNCTFSFTAPDGPGHYTLRMIQDAGGTNTVAWTGGGLSVRWNANTEPTWDTTGSVYNIATFYYDGTNWSGAGWTYS